MKSFKNLLINKFKANPLRNL